MATQLATRQGELGIYDMPSSPRGLWIGANEVAGATFVDAWNDLSDCAVEPNAFYESWYLLPALKAFDQKQEVRFFALWQGDMLIGFLPLADHALYGQRPIAHVQNWLHANAFLGCPLVRAGYEEAFWHALFVSQDAAPGRALFLHLNGLDCDGPLAKALARVAGEQGRRLGLVHQHQRAFLQSELSPDAYYEQAMRGKKRKELRRQHKRLAELGELTFRRLNDDSDLARWSAEFLALERKGWKGSNGSALDCADDTRALFIAALQGAAGQCKLERLELRLDGQPIAMLVNFLTPPGSFSYKTAFDEDFARFSPGVLIQVENLALLEHAEVRWCDSCAAADHPMIDSIWIGRRSIGRYSIAIGGWGKRGIFAMLLKAEQMLLARKSRAEQAMLGDQEQ